MEEGNAHKLPVDPFEHTLDNGTKKFRRYMQKVYEENCRVYVSPVLRCNNHLLKFLLFECICFICYQPLVLPFMNK